jgi:hypothetical protein
MGELGVNSEPALQVNQALLFWMAAILFVLGILAALTAPVFVWHECIVSSRRPPLASCQDFAPRSGFLPLIQITMTTGRRAPSTASVPTAPSDD